VNFRKEDTAGGPATSISEDGASLLDTVQADAGQSVSVLMAVHPQQSPAYLAQALESLRAQSVQAGEVVIVADGVLPQVLLSIIDQAAADLPIKTLSFDRNRGLGAALNAGLAACSKPLVARLDTDDIALGHRLETQLRQIEMTGADICGSSALVVGHDGAMGRTRTVPLSHAAISAALWACPFIHGTVMFRRDRVLAAGGYTPQLRRRQDYDLWFRCKEAGLTFTNIAEPLLVYREHQPLPLGARVGQAWRQGRIGSAHARRLKLPAWTQLACYYPLARAVLPVSLGRLLKRLEVVIDPRRRR
jgi:glycosyltransferase involved in cell wall biosynthesis